MCNCISGRTRNKIRGEKTEGGITRSQSVINGLTYLKEKGKAYERVIILEAARPLITLEQIQKIIKDEHKSTTYALPLTSTVVKRDGSYLNRNELYGRYAYYV